MKLLLKVAVGFFAGLFFLAGSASAFGTNITINDNRNRAVGGIGIGAEDQETEPGMIQAQDWDLEAFYLQGTTLSMVGGFDFISGVRGYSDYQSGDIFIDINGDAQFGIGADENVTNYGYDFVIDLNLNGAGNSSLAYSVYDIRNGAVLQDVLEDYNSPESNPWRYTSGGELVSGAGGMIEFMNLGSADYDGLTGGTHYAVTGIDLGFLLGVTDDFILHFTMGCGNDNLIGKATGSSPVPEPASMLLLGTGLIGIAGLGRKRWIK